MSSLFATLVAAARGEIAVVEPRPRNRFADPARASDIEWREPDPALNPAAQAQPAKAPESPERRPRMHGETAPGRKDHPAPRPEPAAIAAGRARRRDADPVPQGPARAIQRAAPTASERRRRAATGHEPGSPRPERPSRTADARARFEPLLPRKPIAETRPALASPIEPSAARELDPGDPAFTLRIGRIEVRQPAAPAPHAPATPFTRPVVIKRAAVRQSLDEYRTRQRR